MLYTIVDENEIFLTEKKEKYSYKKVANCVLEGVKYNNKTILTRVISTDLKDYLNPDYEIGKKVDW